MIPSAASAGRTPAAHPPGWGPPPYAAAVQSTVAFALNGVVFFFAGASGVNFLVRSVGTARDVPRALLLLCLQNSQCLHVLLCTVLRTKHVGLCNSTSTGCQCCGACRTPEFCCDSRCPAAGRWSGWLTTATPLRSSRPSTWLSSSSGGRPRPLAWLQSRKPRDLLAGPAGTTEDKGGSPSPGSCGLHSPGAQACRQGSCRTPEGMLGLFRHLAGARASRYSTRCSACWAARRCRQGRCSLPPGGASGAVPRALPAPYHRQARTASFTGGAACLASNPSSVKMCAAPQRGAATWPCTPQGRYLAHHGTGHRH